MLILSLLDVAMRVFELNYKRISGINLIFAILEGLAAYVE
jgi:hypothetical protein